MHILCIWYMYVAQLYTCIFYAHVYILRNYIHILYHKYITVIIKSKIQEFFIVYKTTISNINLKQDQQCVV